MRRVTLNFLIDSITFAAMLFMLGTGLILEFVLPPEAGRSGGARVLWGLTRHEWGDVHFWTAVGLCGLLVTHLALHWSWICGMVRRFLTGAASGDKAAHRRLDWAYGLGFVAVVALMIGSFVWVARQTATPGPGHRAQAAARAGGGARDSVEPGENPRDGLSLRGSMTVSQAAAALGVSVEQVGRRLGAGALGPDERLGRAARSLGLTFAEVRARLVAQGDACPMEDESTD